MPPDVFTTAGRIDAVEEFERATGRELDVVHTYHRWHKPFPDAVDKHFLANGQQLLVGWAGSDCPGIRAGNYDELIRKRARDVEALDQLVLIALRWEMDRSNLRSQVRSAADFVAAWKHVRKLFEEEGATNVGWVWAPTAKGFAEGDAADFYPGDDQVDWLAVDAYTGQRVRPLSAVMQPFMDFAVRRPDKPIMIAEFGLADRGGRRPGWLDDARRYVKSHPQIKAALYFSGDVDKGTVTQYALHRSSTGSAAFHTWLADPYFNTKSRPITPMGTQSTRD